MSAFLAVAGLLAWVMATVSFVTVFVSGGTDIQLIVGGVFSIAGAVSWGFWYVLDQGKKQLEQLGTINHELTRIERMTAGTSNNNM